MNFRNYESQEVGFGPGLNLIEGPNAQGKTNLLEAVFLLSSSRLLRGQRDAEAIREGADMMSVRGLLANGSTEIQITLARGGRKKALLNSIALPRAADLLGRLPCVCISSLDLEIVRGEPSERRLFLDLELSALSPRYLQHFTQYRKGLEQRNALLKTAREFHVEESAFEAWEVQLAEHGAVIRELRQNYVHELSPTLQGFQEQLGKGEQLLARIVPSDEAITSSDFRSSYARMRQAEIGRGSTLIGPHRDDLELMLDGKSVRLYGSQGQQRSSAISLKLGSMSVSRDRLGSSPVLLLDDIFSDLDARRRQVLVEIVCAHAGQTILTCTEATLAGPRIMEQARLFRVEQGRVHPG